MCPRSKYRTKIEASGQTRESLSPNHRQANGDNRSHTEKYFWQVVRVFCAEEVDADATIRPFLLPSIKPKTSKPRVPTQPESIPAGTWH